MTNPSASTGDESITLPSKRRWRPTRRGFLIGAGVAGVGVALGVTLGLPALRLTAARFLDNGSAPGSFTEDPWAWFEITPENQVLLYVSKVEMGQGIHTAIAQIGAEELAIPWEQMQVVQASTHTGPADSFGTGASNSVSTVYDPLRRAAATLREMLRQEAALVLNVTAAQLVARNGRFVVAGDEERTLTYGQIVAGKSEWEIPEEEISLKAVDAYEVIGQPKPRLDIPAKVTGQAVYGYDQRMEGMLYGAVLRPPTINATLQEIQAGDADTVEGVVKVVTASDFAGVVATSRAAARQGLGRLKATWNEGRLWQQDEIEALVLPEGSGGVTIQKEGDAPGILRKETSLRSEYSSPMAVHSPMEPQAALAHVMSDRAILWVSTQFQNTVRAEVAEAIGMAEEAVEVIPTYLGGGFGRKLNTEAALEAAKLSQAAGVPVHVGWDRTEEMRYGYFRPPTRSHLSAALDDNGHIQALEHRLASGDVAFPFFPAAAAALLGADFGAWRGATVHYENIPHRRTAVWRSKLPVRTGWWRGLGLLANTFAIESFVDELAHLAGQNPLDFRLAHLGEDARGTRMKAVLERAAQMAGWGNSRPAGRALGIACATDVDTTVAQVAEISLDRSSGQITVHNVWCAMDPGLVINPDGATAQAQGAIMMGLSSTLIEEIRVKDGQIVPANFDTYPLLTIGRAPQVEVALLEAPDRQPRGVGEPPIGPIAAAVGNAFFALTGVRIRRMPLSPDRVLAALQAAT